MALIYCRKDTISAMMTIQRMPAPHFFKKAGRRSFAW
jgi:hypothetical protein